MVVLFFIEFIDASSDFEPFYKIIHGVDTYDFVSILINWLLIVYDILKQLYSNLILWMVNFINVYVL